MLNYDTMYPVFWNGSQTLWYATINETQLETYHETLHHSDKAKIY